MDDELFDLEDQSVDEMREEFEKFKVHCAESTGTSNERLAGLCMEEDLQDLHDLRDEVKQLRLDMELLQKRQTELMGWHDVNAIQDRPSSINEALQYAKDELQQHSQQKITFEQLHQDDIFEQQQEDEYEQQKLEEEQPPMPTLVISCGSSPCLFEHCRRRVDSQLLLLHYLCDHNDETETSKRCHKLREGQRVVLSFDTRNCPFKENYVIGVLAFAGDLTQQQQEPQPQSPQTARREIYNSFLPEEHAHLESDVPIVVLICKTAANTAFKDKQQVRRAQAQANPMDQVFVIWLATPHNQLQLNATLNLSGRDAAVQANKTVSVRQVHQSQDTCRFMPVDANYWRLSFNEMKKLSNDFRDELHLEISLNVVSASFRV